MSSIPLIDRFDRLMDAPGAIGQVRRFVLELAVRGALVPQRPTIDAPAEIDAAQVEAITQEGIPIGWVRGTVGRLLDFKYGKGLPDTARKPAGSVPVFGSNGIIGHTADALTEKPAVIVGRKGSAGALNVCRGPSWTTDVAYYIETPPYFHLDFLVHALRALDLERLGKGVKPGLSRSDAYRLNLLVPPLAEQGRIVARMNKLFAICDQLERAQHERDDQRGRLLLAALTRLVDQTAADATACTEHVRFVLDAMPRLTNRAAEIEQLRRVIVDLAVSGKLTKRDDRHKPAGDLLARAEQERECFAGVHDLSFNSRTTIPAAPYVLPRGWEWAHLSELCLIITDGDHQPPPKSNGGIAFLTIGNITTGTIDFSGARFVPPAYYEALARYRVPEEGDLLYTVVGATYGRPALVETTRPFCVQRHIAILKPSKAMNVRFLFWLLTSSFIYDQAARSTTGIAQPTIGLRSLRKFVMPVPPRAEQDRIVETIDRMMLVCRELSSALNVASDKSVEALEALLRQTLDQVAVRHVQPEPLDAPRLMNT